MKKLFKKSLAVILAVVLTLTAAPLGGFVGLEFTSLFDFKAEAATEYTSGYYTYTVTDGEATIIDCKYNISGNVTIPSTLGGYPVTIIGKGAFDNCDSLTGITIPEGVTIIGDSAFESCDNLTSVTIPNSVTIIGKECFYFCDRLATVTISESVTSIGLGAFLCCYSLASIIVDSDNKYYSNDSYGVLFNRNKTKVIQYPAGNTRTNYVLPNGVETIDSWSFAYCENLTNVTMPNSVVTIGDSAFEGCYITSVTIPDSVTIIGDSAFESCDSLTSVTIPDSVTTIGNEIFYSCDSLTDITIGNSVKTIGERAFCSCDSLASIIVDTDNKYYSNDSYGVLFNKNKTKVIQYPAGNTRTNYVLPNGVETIDSWSFAYCENLTNVTMPNSVVTIGDSAFEGCYITSVTIPDSVEDIEDGAFGYCWYLSNVKFGKKVTTIGESAFVYCYSITSLNLPNDLTNIGEGAFLFCENLTSVVIPDKVVNMGPYAFAYCYSLAELTIPDSVTSIGEAAFFACGLTSIDVSTGNSYYSSDNYGVLFDKNKTTLIQYPASNERKNYTVPNSVTTIGDYAFLCCFNLTSITISDSVTTIGYGVFPYSSLTDVYYKGTQAQWKRISIGDDNECLTNANIHYIYSICSREFDKNLDYYAENWDSANYNPELANIMAALSKAVYSENDIDSACEALGFVGYGVYDYDTEYNPLTCGYSLAFKKSDYNDDIICLVSVRGSQKLNYNADWIGNFMFMTEETKHKGFSDPANNIYEVIQNETENMTGNIKYFITGHSRGAAVANLLSVKLMEKGVSSSDIYNYNFACPDVACRVTFTEYNNIFNLCNREDIVPFIPGNIASAFTTPGTSWGKFGQTYWFTKDAPDTIDPFADHDMNLYLEFFDQQLTPSNWGENFKDKLDDATNIISGWITKIMCPVDVVITDENGNNIASVIGGEVNYYNSQVGNVLIFTDGDKKVIYINGDNDFNVNLVGTDSGEMTYSVERYNVQGEEVLESKTFTNVKLEEGKQMFSPVSNADNADDVELFVTETQNGQQVVTHTVSTSGTETVIENETPDNPDEPSDPTIDWEEITPEINEPSKIKIKFGDTLVLQLDEIEIPEGYAIAWFVEGAGVSTWVSEDGLECRVTSIANGSPTIYAKLVDEEENVITNADGEEIFDEITLVSKAGFWQRFISFFKNLFGINRVIY